MSKNQVLKIVDSNALIEMAKKAFEPLVVYLYAAPDVTSHDSAIFDLWVSLEYTSDITPRTIDVSIFVRDSTLSFGVSIQRKPYRGEQDYLNYLLFIEAETGERPVSSIEITRQTRSELEEGVNNILNPLARALTFGSDKDLISGKYWVEGLYHKRDDY